MKNQKNPCLHFGPGDVSGWTPVGLSGYRAMKPTAAIRELIQNGLDAASDAGVIPARMRFRVEECQTSDIPGIDSYQVAFNKAQESQLELFKGQIPDNAKSIIKDISDCLEKSTCKVLHILDNGIGLDKVRMEALLGDGMSVKDPNASGSYGNGHVVAFPASDLRYVLYGGLFAENQTHKRICAGHVILASRQDKNGGILSKDGYFVNELKDDMFDRYVFPEEGNVPNLIRRQLDWIQSEWRTGSVVSIVCFNHFRSNDINLQKEIFRAASCNFFEAIYRDHMVIEFEDNENIEFLNKNTLERVLRENKDQKRSIDTFLSGKRAYEAFHALKEGKKEIVSTELGEMEIVVMYPADSGLSRVDLCRNGMWITDDIPKFQNQFGNLTPFHCVIPLLENTELNRLFREAEGPLHNDLTLSLLSNNKKKRKQLESVLSAIRDKLKDVVPVLEDESFRPDDIFLVETKGLAKGAGKKANMGGATSRFKRPRVQLNNDDEEDENNGADIDNIDVEEDESDVTPDKPRRKKTKPFQRNGSQMQFQGLVVPKGYRTCKVSIVSGEKTQESEIRFALDESIDVTSHGVTKDTFAIIKPDGLKLNGRPAEEKELRKNDNGEILGVVLGGLEQKQKYDIEFDYIIPKQLQISDNQHVVLKAEMMRRASSDTEEGELS